MTTNAFRRTSFAVVLAVVAVFGAFADDPVYITGAEYEIEGDRLTVTSGNGTLVLQTPNSISSICVTNGASLKIGRNNPFAKTPKLYLYGKKRETSGCDFATFDLNGHDVTVSICDNSWNKGASPTAATPPHPGPGRVINTAQTAASFTMSGTGSTYFYGNFEELPGKISVTANNGNLCICPTVTEHPASSFTISSTSQLQLLDRSQQLLFVFDPPAGTSNGAVRFAELSPTAGGVPVVVSEVVASSASAVATYNDIASLTDAKATTAFGTRAGESHSFCMTIAGYPAIDGYRLAPFGTDSTYLTAGCKVYSYRHQYIGWVLVDEKGEGELPWPTNTTQSSTVNIPFSANSRIGSLFGANTEFTVESTKSPNVRVSHSAVESVASLSGDTTKSIRLENGSVFAVADLSGFTGIFLANGSTMGQQGQLALVAGESAEHALTITNGQNIAIVNGGTDNVSVLMDDTRTEHLFGQMKDGENGRLGLVNVVQASE